MWPPNLPSMVDRVAIPEMVLWWLAMKTYTVTARRFPQGHEYRIPPSP